VIDTKILLVEDKVLTHVIEKIKDQLGEMTVTCRKEHIFLGMNLSFHEEGTASIKMKNYIKEAKADFGESITRSARTPAKRNLFEIHKDRGAFSDDDQDIFHSTVAKLLLYISKRGRLDIQLAVAFLCT
jgi:hypothetical protein